MIFVTTKGCRNHDLKLKLGKNDHSYNSIWLAVNPPQSLFMQEGCEDDEFAFCTKVDTGPIGHSDTGQSDNPATVTLFRFPSTVTVTDGAIG